MLEWKLILLKSIRILEKVWFQNSFISSYHVIYFLFLVFKGTDKYKTYLFIQKYFTFNLINKHSQFLEADKKETPTQMFFCEFCDFFTNISFYRAPPVFLSYTNPIGLWGPKPNNKIIASIISSLSFVLELPKTYSKDNLQKKKCPCKCLLKCVDKIWAFIKILHRFW